MLSTDGVKGGSPQYPGRLDPGVHDVKIASVVAGVSTVKKTPYVEITFTDGVGQHRETFYFAQGQSTTISLEKIKHLGTKILDENAMNAIKAPDVQGYADALAAVLVGKNVRIKLSGKEQWNTKTNKSFVERFFNLYPWAESADVPRAESKLKYDQNKLSDYKPLPKLEDASADGLGMPAPTNTSIDTDLPF